MTWILGNQAVAKANAVRRQAEQRAIHQDEIEEDFFLVAYIPADTAVHVSGMKVF